LYAKWAQATRVAVPYTKSNIPLAIIIIGLLLIITSVYKVCQINEINITEKIKNIIKPR
jgi:hypothetical protein